MLEAYQFLLARLRRDENVWPEVAHYPLYRDDGQMEDRNYRPRYGVLLCLQYDRRGEDHTLVRYLLAAETQSRSNDPFQGETSALLLAAYLLACFRRVEDVWLLWQAKSANFDTFCALDTLHLFAGGLTETLDYLHRSDHPEGGELLQRFDDDTSYLNIPTPEQMEQFWEDRQRLYPADPAQEDALTWAQRAWELDQIAEGRLRLDRWQARQPVSAQMLFTLMHTRDRLNQPEEALACACQLLEMAGTDIWKQASAQFNVGRYTVQAAEYEQAWKMLEEIIQSLEEHPERRFLGQHIATLELALSLGEAVPAEHPLRHDALWQAHALIEQGFSTSYNILKQASELAQTLGEAALEQHYRDLAEQEHLRIQRQL